MSQIFAVISRLRAASHILENKNDIQYNLKFLFVPPKFSADPKNETATSPVFPTKKNPLFHSTTERADMVAGSRPYPVVPSKVTDLLRLLGIDESIIAKNLDDDATHEMMETRERQVSTSVSAALPSHAGVAADHHWGPVPAPKQDVETQTPPLRCRHCDDRARKEYISLGIQTSNVSQMYAESTQTSETDFTLAKLRAKQFGDYSGVNVKQEFSRDRFSNDIRIGPPGSNNLLQPRKNERTYSFKFT